MNHARTLLILILLGGLAQVVCLGPNRWDMPKEQALKVTLPPDLPSDYAYTLEVRLDF
jgi:hypothetical protein